MPDEDASVLEFFTQPGRMTSLGNCASRVAALPDDVTGLAAVGHGLVIHEHIAPNYGVTLAEDERASVHIRPVDRLLDLIVERDDRPFDVPRDPAARTPGNCRHFTVLMVALLRAKGVPARARCGFGGYFGTGAFEDHWVCEYWNAEQRRWVLVDAQIDARQREMFPIDFDLTDVPRDRFLVAGDAWAQCRAGKADPNSFGLSMAHETGAWWIAGNLMRDAAALAGVELLPWDCWGAMPTPNDVIHGELAAHFDGLARLTSQPDADDLAELRRMLREDERLRVPSRVFNAVLKRQDAL